MKERPILFSTPMVQAILDGRKTQTRRIIKRKFPHGEPEGGVTSLGGWPVHFPDGTWENEWCPYGMVGDRLWVREAFGQLQDEDGGGYVYRANVLQDGEEDFIKQPWKPSIHMPRAAARLFLEITDVRVDQLHNISEEEALAEGVEEVGTGLQMYKMYRDYEKSWNDGGYTRSPDVSFETLWISINGHDSWDANPWVWVVEFKRV